MIFICIPVFERLQLTINCINSIKRQTYTSYTVVVCEHSPSNTTYNELKRLFPDIVLLRGDESMWWTAATNKCVEYALQNGSDDDYVFTLNNDTELDENCLEILMAAASERPNTIFGCVNLLFNERDRIEPSAQVLRSFWGLALYRPVNKWKESIQGYVGLSEVSALSGKGVLIPQSVFTKVGVYNEKLLPHYHADTELTARAAKSGFQVFLNYAAKVYSHHEETGLTARSLSTSFKNFIAGFSSVKSTRHFPTLINKARLLHGQNYLVYLSINLIGVIGGFIKRWARSLLANCLSSFSR